MMADRKRQLHFGLKNKFQTKINNNNRPLYLLLFTAQNPCSKQRRIYKTQKPHKKKKKKKQKRRSIAHHIIPTGDTEMRKINYIYPTDKVTAFVLITSWLATNMPSAILTKINPPPYGRDYFLSYTVCGSITLCFPYDVCKCVFQMEKPHLQYSISE